MFFGFRDQEDWTVIGRMVLEDRDKVCVSPVLLNCTLVIGVLV